MPIWLIWIIIAIILLIVEMLTPEFIVGSFAVGCIIAAVTSYFTSILTIQLIVFSIVTVLFLWKVRPVFLRYMDNNSKTNVDLLVGQKGKVIREIGPQEEKGRVKIGGEDWQALSHGNYIPEGARIRVEKIRGVTVIVKVND